MDSLPAPTKHMGYGTAGFRDNAKQLPRVLYSVGLLAGLRSRFLKGRTIGVMITASHNPPQDNGAKLIDPLGEMLEQSWEEYATVLANAPSAEALDKELANLYKKLDVDRSIEANVIYGRDTRESGPELVAALEAALQADSVHPSSAGLVTTPQLHYLVRGINTLNQPGYESYGVPTEEGYYKKLATAYKKIASLCPKMKPIEVTVDCANGVGALKLEQLAPFLKGLVKFDIVNDRCNEPSQLNHDCGADYVKTNQRLPANVKPEPGRIYSSFDGDADRVVFYYTDKDNVFHLLDGDKIATLAASIFQEQVRDVHSEIKVGVVQTAYANGASTRYLSEQLDVPVLCTPTGVKHLHHAATEFGIGVYFEANGHGTILFDPETVSRLRTMAVSSPAQKQIIDVLLALSDLINQTVGDAISDLLVVLVILALREWSPEQWDACYTDLPNRLLKASVKDRTLFKTTDAERKLVEPAELQPKLDALMKQYDQGRTFVRASGTEDVVRVYAEAATRAKADELADEVVKLLAPYQ